MSVELLKKSAPFILLLDIMTLLMFMYMSMPHETDFIRLKVNFNQGIMDGSILEARSNNSEILYKKSIFHDHLFDIDLTEKSFLFRGVECKTDSVCAEKIGIKPSNEERYYIFFPDNKMKTALALRYSFCDKYKCDGSIYFNAKTGLSFICSSEKEAIYIDEINGKVDKYYGASCI